MDRWLEYRDENGIRTSTNIWHDAFCELMISVAILDTHVYAYSSYQGLLQSHIAIVTSRARYGDEKIMRL